jgi:hypothetical protein
VDPHHQGGEHQRRLIGDFPKPRLDIPYFRSANRIGTTRQALRKIFVTSMAGPACDKFYGFDRDNSGDLRDARWAAEQMGGDIDTILETGAAMPRR